MVELDLKLHSAFFDRLVELIPAKHYLAQDEERTDLRFLKKNERAAAKAQFKQQYKDAKREKLNPDTAKGTLELQKLKATIAPSKNDADVPPAAADRDVLKEKLQKRLEDMRKQRKADEQVKKVHQAKEWRDTTLEKGREAAAKKRHRDDALTLKPASTTAAASTKNHRHGYGNDNEKNQSPKKQRTKGGDTTDAPSTINKDGLSTKRKKEKGNDFSFSKIEFGNGDDHRKNKKKSSKQELLAEAERKKQQAQQAEDGSMPNNTTSSDANQKAGKEAWSAAVARAQGNKVLDDPRLLKKSIKKDQKLKKKKTQAWNERLDRQKEAQNAQQTKRKENLQSRITAKKENKKVRREKKLLRAGFEGRKQGFIASPSPGGGKK